MYIHGKDIILSDSNGDIVAASKSCELDMSCGVLDTSSPSSGSYRTIIPEQKEWSVSMSYLLYTLYKPTTLLGKELTITIQNANDDSDYLVGSAICTKCKITATKGSLAQGSFVFTGNGELR